MKVNKLVSALAAIIFAGSLVIGCVHLPKAPEFSPVPAASHPNVSFPDLKNSPAVINNPAPSTASPAKKAIQTTINWVATLAIFLGVAAIGWGAFKIYSGFPVTLLAGVQYILGGIGTIIAAIYIAYHWILVMTVTAILVGFYLLIRYKVLSHIKPAIEEVESEVKSVLPGNAQAGVKIV